MPFMGRFLVLLSVFAAFIFFDIGLHTSTNQETLKAITRQTTINYKRVYIKRQTIFIFLMFHSVSFPEQTGRSYLTGGHIRVQHFSHRLFALKLDKGKALDPVVFKLGDGDVGHGAELHKLGLQTLVGGVLGQVFHVHRTLLKRGGKCKKKNHMIKRKLTFKKKYC